MRTLPKFTVTMAGVLISLAATAAPAWAQDSGYAPIAPGTGAGTVSFPTIVTAQTVGPDGATLTGAVVSGTVTVQVKANVLTRTTQIAIAEARVGSVPQTLPEVAGCVRMIDGFAITVAATEEGTNAPTVPVTTGLTGDALTGDGVRVVVRGSAGTQVVVPAQGAVSVDVLAPAKAYVVAPTTCEPAPVMVAGEVITRAPGKGVAPSSEGQALAFTGAPVAGVAAAAAGFLVVGAGAVLASRRRRR